MPTRLRPVLTHDQRNLIGNDDRDGISFATANSSASAPPTAASSLVGGLDGKRIAIEGFGPAGVGIAREAAAAGATISRVSTAKGFANGQLDPVALARGLAG